jgi:hypothetical protein
MTISRWFHPRMKNVSIQVVEKIKTQILCSVTFFRKSCRLWYNVEKCGGARVDAIRRLRVTNRISKPTRAQVHAYARAPHSHTHAHIFLQPRARSHAHTQILTAFHGNIGFMKAPQWYVTRALPLFFWHLFPSPIMLVFTVTHELRDVY